MFLFCILCILWSIRFFWSQQYESGVVQHKTNKSARSIYISQYQLNADIYWHWQYVEYCYSWKCGQLQSAARGDSHKSAYTKGFVFANPATLWSFYTKEYKRDRKPKGSEKKGQILSVVDNNCFTLEHFKSPIWTKKFLTLYGPEEDLIWAVYIKVLSGAISNVYY